MEIFYSSEIDGKIVRLDKDESTHCVRVLRHKEGDKLSIIDGRGNLYTCKLIDANPKAVIASIESIEKGYASHPYRLSMAVCPTKNIDRYEWFAEKATEIGVDRIAPVIGEHSERKTLKTERLKRILLSACKQSLKASIPEILEPLSVKDYILATPSNAHKLICYCSDEIRQRVSISEALKTIIQGDKPNIHILIGPEGDFSPSEIELALSSGWQAVHLGPSRLRTETAALSAVNAVYLSFL